MPPAPTGINELAQLLYKVYPGTVLWLQCGGCKTVIAKINTKQQQYQTNNQLMLNNKKLELN
eukprot:11175311-Lingulodinium_polyedra.AAC.1